MEKLLVNTVLFAALVFFVPVLGTLFGAFSGWVVGLFFEATILDFLARIGVAVAGLALWKVGAAMGFLGGFLKTSVTTRN